MTARYDSLGRELGPYESARDELLEVFEAKILLAINEFRAEYPNVDECDIDAFISYVAHDICKTYYYNDD